MPKHSKAVRKYLKKMRRVAERRLWKNAIKFPDERQAEFRPGDRSIFWWDTVAERWRCTKCGWGVVPRVLYKPRYAHKGWCPSNPKRVGAKKKREAS